MTQRMKHDPKWEKTLVLNDETHFIKIKVTSIYIMCLSVEAWNDKWECVYKMTNNYQVQTPS